MVIFSFFLSFKNLTRPKDLIKMISMHREAFNAVGFLFELHFW